MSRRLSSYPGGANCKHMKRKDSQDGIRIRRIRKPGGALTVQRKMWQAVLAAEDLLMSPKATFDDQIRAVHALQQAASAYARLLEVVDLQEQVDAMQTQIGTLNEHLSQIPSV